MTTATARKAEEHQPSAAVINLAEVAAKSLPCPDMSLNLSHTALVLVDPQKGFLDPEGSLWPAVKNGVRGNNVIEHLEWLLDTACSTGMLRVVCPHHHDHRQAESVGVGRVAAWANALPGRSTEHVGQDGDILPCLTPYLQDDNAVITGTHRLCGLANRDLMQELRARRITQVILAGMCANLCLEGHLRDLVENGFSVAIVSDATAGIAIDGVDARNHNMHSFRLLANAVWDTRETILRMYGKNV